MKKAIDGDRIDGVSRDADGAGDAEFAPCQIDACLPLITDALPLMIALLDRKGRYRFVNRQGESWLGKSRREIVGLTLDATLKGADSDQVRRHIEDALEGHKVHFDAVLVPPDGAARKVDVVLLPFRRHGQKPHGLYVLFLDVIDREAAERRFGQLADAVPVLIAQLTPDLRFRFINRTGEQWYARDREQILGYSIKTILGKDAYDAIRSELDAALQGKTAVFERRITYPDGVARDVQLTYVTHRGSDGEVDGVFCLTTDVSGLKATQVQLLKAQKMEAVGQLAGGVAHDFNNLLTVVLGNARLLEKALGAADGAASRSLDAIVGAAKRGASLTRRLLAFSRRETIDPKVVDAREVVSGLLEMRQALGEAIEITAHLGDEPLNILVDPHLFEMALLNLATNARDAMPEGGTLTIALESARVDDGKYGPGIRLPSGEYVVLSISDTGRGIPRHHLGRIFEPFFTTKEVGKGTGLGLSMVFGFVEQSGGQVHVRSKPGGGTTFFLFFPRAGSVGGPRPESRARMGAATGRRQKILVVEDEPGIRMIASAILGNLGFRVLEAANGREALAMLEQHPDIELLFTDNVMPGGMNGLEVAKRARERNPDLRVLLTTGNGEDGHLLKGGLPEGMDFLAKPYEAVKLAEGVCGALGLLPKASGSVTAALTAAARLRRRRTPQGNPSAATPGAARSRRSDDVSGGKRILVVDDQPMVREMISDVLSDAGHTVITARDGIAGLEILESEPVDILVTDIFMPDGEGIETIFRVREDHPEVRIIAISGGGRTSKFEVLRIAQESGAHATLAKPFESEELLEAVAKVDRLPRAQAGGNETGQTMRS